MRSLEVSHPANGQQQSPGTFHCVCASESPSDARMLNLGRPCFVEFSELIGHTRYSELYEGMAGNHGHVVAEAVEQTLERGFVAFPSGKRKPAVPLLDGHLEWSTRFTKGERGTASASRSSS